MNREYRGEPLDGTVQYITERPRQPGADEDEDETDGETVYATAPEPAGTATTENVPIPGDDADAPDVEGQSTFGDWGWSVADGEGGADG